MLPSTLPCHSNPRCFYYVDPLERCGNHLFMVFVFFFSYLTLFYGYPVLVRVLTICLSVLLRLLLFSVPCTAPIFLYLFFFSNVLPFLSLHYIIRKIVWYFNASILLSISCDALVRIFWLKLEFSGEKPTQSSCVWFKNVNNLFKRLCQSSPAKIVIKTKFDHLLSKAQP